MNKERDGELVALLQDLVRIPSWVPDDPSLKTQQNENGVVDYLEEWLRINTNLEVQRQPLEYGRNNLIAAKGNPDLVFLAHTDTVQPSENAPYDQLAAEIHDGKIWGRGATDMKSGIASMVQALSLSPDADNVWMFLYADEEYNFLGMKALVETYGDLKPELIVSSDGSDLKIGYGCRGLIELRARVKGETGHPALGTGNNAIWGSFEALSQLWEYLSTFEHPIMGKTSFNLSHILGGAIVKDSISERGRLQQVGQAGNVVPDVAEFVVDIRPASPDLDIDRVVGILAQGCEERQLGLKIVERTHNLGAWYTEIQEIETYVQIAQGIIGSSAVELDDPERSGYLDLQMFWDKVGRPPAFMFGGGIGDTAHTPTEHIPIENLIKERDFFLKVLEKHSTKE